MKTILYQPIFINPQAYYVFPQLTQIEPSTDEYIEKAIYTGKLIVTSTSIVRQYSNSNYIDLSEFAGDTITIDQFTEEGSTRLGSWVLPSKDTVLSYIPDMLQQEQIQDLQS